MKKFLQLLLTIFVGFMGFSQNLKPVAQRVADFHATQRSFIKFSPFTVENSQQKSDLYRKSASDVTVMQLKASEISKIVSEKPEAMELTFPFEGKEITVDLVKNNILTSDFSVKTSGGKTFNYVPGVYYQGVVQGDNTSLVAFSFFENDVVGVTSIKNLGNIVVGKAIGSQDFVSYSDEKMTGTNPFVCGADDLEYNKKKVVSFNPRAKSPQLTDNCVRIYYEVGYGPYTQNGSSVATTTNWVTAMHNNISTLYANDGIRVALSSVFVWTVDDITTYSGTPSQVLAKFRAHTTSFNGDIGQLIRNPATTSIAYLDTLCTNYNYSYAGVNKTYSNVPAYSWNIEAMTHEMGHNLGSPHTHACAWNGDDSAIDGCGPAAGYPEGCDAPLPTNGGTIMSYCHLVSSVGINFANGFGPQPGQLIRNSVNSSGCLGTNCTTSCTLTVTQASVSAVTKNSATGTIVDNISTNWKYKLAKFDGTVVASGNTTSKTVNFTGLESGVYYIFSVGTDCSGPDAFQKQQFFLTDADWCSGVAFTDTGGTTKNYENSQTIVKTFYPTAGQKLKLTFTEFGLEQDYDYLSVFDGTSTSAPVFAGGANLTGAAVPGPFTATSPSGAITVSFVSDGGATDIGWNASFQCISLGTNDISLKDQVNVSPNPTKNKVTISSPEKIISYKIYDNTGKLVLKQEKLNALSAVFDLASFPAGNYVVSITTASQTVNKKIIKY